MPFNVIEIRVLWLELMRNFSRVEYVRAIGRFKFLDVCSCGPRMQGTSQGMATFVSIFVEELSVFFSRNLAWNWSRTERNWTLALIKSAYMSEDWDRLWEVSRSFISDRIFQFFVRNLGDIVCFEVHFLLEKEMYSFFMHVVEDLREFFRDIKAPSR